MKKMMMFAALAAIVGVVAGCFTSATAYTEKTNPDGTKTVSKVKIVGTGDKASQIAAEGLFADGAAEDLGAGVKNASATQQSTGIKETLEGMGVLLTGIGNLVNRAQGVPATTTVATVACADTDTQPAEAAQCAVDVSPTEFTGSPGEKGVGVYGKAGCSRCAAYKVAHPDVSMIDLGIAANQKAMWDALKELKFTGSSVSLPVEITATGFTQAAK